MRFMFGGRKQLGRIGLAAALGLSAIAVPSAHAAGKIANPYDCAPQPNLAQSFAAWNDYGLYTPVENAGVEQGAAGWTLTGGASVVAGNEPWKIGGASHSNALNLPEGASATTAPLCIDETYPHFRLFVRNAGSVKTALKIEVVYFDNKGKVTNTKPYDYKTDLPAWQPTGMVGINVFTPKTAVAAAPIAFRFTPNGKGASYQIDDVYVDPRMAR
jgi:hypothetical protein